MGGCCSWLSEKWLHRNKGGGNWFILCAISQMASESNSPPYYKKKARLLQLILLPPTVNVASTQKQSKIGMFSLSHYWVKKDKS